MQSTTNKNRSPLLIVFLTIFIDMLGVGILIPVFPMLIMPHSPFRVTPDSWSIHQGFIMLGWLSATFPLAQFFCSPLLGQLSDKHGRKKILAISIAGTAASYLLFALAVFSKNIPLMFLARMLDGITGGNISVAQAVIADVSSPKNRAKNFGLIGMAFGLGFILGPAIGGILSDNTLVSWFNVQLPFYFACVLSLINSSLVLRLLPETLKKVNNAPINIFRPIKSLSIAFTQKELRSVMPSTFMFNAGFTFFTTFFGVILAHKYGFNSGKIGNYFAYIGIMIVLMQGGLVRRLSGRIADYKVLRFSMFGSALVLLVYSVISPQHSYLLYFIPPFMAIFNALTNSFNSSLLARITPDELKGQSFGVRSSTTAMAQALPALAAGYLATINASLPILIGAITIAVGGVLFWLLFIPKEHEKCTN